MKSSFLSVLLWGILCVGVTFLPNTLYAEESTDCAETARFSEDDYVKKVLEEIPKLPYDYQSPLTFFTDKDMKTALRFHQQACCEDKINEKTCQGKLDGTLYYPHSPYLFDHLVNIGMRKLDGIQEHCDILGIDCTTRTNTVLAKERREKSQEMAEDTDGVPPEKIFQTFTTYRGNLDDFGTEAGKDKIGNAYYTMCAEAVRIALSTKLGLSSSVNKSEARTSGCHRLVQQRYAQEIAYVQSLMVDKGVQYLYENMRAYFQTYFINTRMSALVNKYGQLDACRNMVLKFVTRTSCCVY